MVFSFSGTSFFGKTRARTRNDCAEDDDAAKGDSQLRQFSHGISLPPGKKYRRHVCILVELKVALQRIKSCKFAVYSTDPKCGPNGQ